MEQLRDNELLLSTKAGLEKFATTSCCSQLTSDLDRRLGEEFHWRSTRCVRGHGTDTEKTSFDPLSPCPCRLGCNSLGFVLSG
jgi:hypothetical protein